MNKQINFEDNIFILAARIRMIRDIITLDVDPELFLEKTLDDICFIDFTLNNLLEQLTRNERLIERDAHIEQLCEAEWQFSQVLDDFLNHEGNISIRGIPPVREKIAAFRKSSLERRRSAENLNPDEDGTGGEAVVSSAELNELLKAF